MITMPKTCSCPAAVRVARKFSSDLYPYQCIFILHLNSPLKMQRLGSGLSLFNLNSSVAMSRIRSKVNGVQFLLQ